MSIVDACIAAVVLVVVLLPERSPAVRAEYPDTAPIAEIADYQARLAADPGDCATVQKLTEILVRLEQSDWALRVAGEGAHQTESPTLWRCFLALSSVHADRFEIREAHAQAVKAWEACDAPGAQCPAHERVRLGLYLSELDAGIEAIRQGIDPRTDPRRFRSEINSAYMKGHFNAEPDDEVEQPESEAETAPQPGSERETAVGMPDE